MSPTHGDSASRRQRCPRRATVDRTNFPTVRRRHPRVGPSSTPCHIDAVGAQVHQGSGSIAFRVENPLARSTSEHSASGPPCPARCVICQIRTKPRAAWPDFKCCLHLRTPNDGPIDHQPHSGRRRRGHQSFGSFQCGCHWLFDQSLDKPCSAAQAPTSAPWSVVADTRRLHQAIHDAIICRWSVIDRAAIIRRDTRSSKRLVWIGRRQRVVAFVRCCQVSPDCPRRDRESVR